jgi:glycosyltransferase involved in cell wall biosynthesis
VNKKKQLKVLHAAISLDCGGLEHLIVAMCRHGRDHNGNVPEVLCLERLGTLSHNLIEDGVPVHCVSKPPGLRLKWTRREVLKLLQQIKPDIVHSHQIGVLLHVGRAARKLGITVVHSEHGKHYEHSIKQRCLGRIASRSAQSFVCVSDDIASSVRQRRIAPDARIEFIPNGIDVAFFSAGHGRDEIRSQLNIVEPAFVIGTVGRLSEVKRHELLIKAFAEIAKAADNVHLLIVGDGELRGSLESLSAVLGLSSKVHFVGYRADRDRYLSAMDIFALTSRSEGMPLAILEAWASKLPVIASEVGGIPGILQSGLNGLLFPSGDQTALVHCLTRLLRDSKLRSQLAAQSHADVCEKYSFATMFLQYQELYQRVHRQP